MGRKRPIGPCGRTLYLTETGQRARALVYYCKECEGNHLAEDKKRKKQ